ncbi:PREDICTED: UPF0160 protein MYG1, mitochondrial-like [Branchiostoma belcheri]|uniref:UPF0160 protein MYG1, mitochondrial-like n=1 Tax=Branchiostoma belcheri TaxID=7741 RepID=A0A6P5AKT7_BRABE|nr:PREDICTED: UPF0160 protein MYG1, mitochondrial-like [Branchiostoma belcheri]
MSQPNKKLRENGDAKQIGTHDGTFHCDEALACYLLRKLPRYRDCVIVRSRNPDVLAGCDVVVDVGGKYDPATHRYDHHQRTFTETMHSLVPEKPWVTKLSSAGLVYLHFGHEIIANALGDRGDDKKLCNVVYDKVYQNLIEEIDAIDNGISQHDGSPRYAMSTHLSARVGRLNPGWNEPDQDTDNRFRAAMAMVGEEFEDRVRYYSQVWWPGRKLVRDALDARQDVDPSGEVILMEQVCPWKEHLFELEREMGVAPGVKYVLYADQGGNWRVQCVPIEPQSFQNRLSLPEAWRGVRDEELSKLSGIDGCIFVHASGFIGGNKTKEGALLMAQKALQMSK